MTDLKKLGKYEIRGELGQGAMGIVYDGFDPMIARRVALKTVRRDQLDRAEVEEILARFKREAQAAAGSTTRTSCRSTNMAKTTALPSSPWSSSRGAN
jgi:serine/threonine protein kinase